MLRLALLVGSGAVLVYAAGFVLWYSGTPLGLFPVLDGREMLALALAIASGELPAEPFYRAPLYPAVLSLLVEAGVPLRELPFVARLLNGALHLVSTGLVWTLARRLWRHDGAALLAGALYGFNPVALHFAADPLDVSLAIALLLGGVLAALAARERLPAAGLLLASTGVLLALAALARPQLAAVLAAWCTWLAWATFRGRVTAYGCAAGVVPVVALLAAMGSINLALGGEFRVLPWQGSFDLHAANRPGANGRYFVQTTRAASYDSADNPARLEAERRFAEANPGRAVTPANVSSYWRETLARDIADAPAAWFALLARKAWYLLNDLEQYNNKTYAFHKARSPWLRPNPLGWAVVLALAAGGIAAGWRRADVRFLGWLAGAYAAALLLSYVSARFRLPLVALLAACAGGVVPALSRAGTRLRVGLTVLLVLALSLVPVSRAEREKTFVQDWLLLARANAELGQFDDAVHAATQALERAPEHPAALELVCVSGFNRWLYGRGPEPAPEACRRAAAHSPPAQRIEALRLWRAGNHERAIAGLEALAEPGSPEREASLALLLLLGHRELADVGRPASGAGGDPTVLLVARMMRGDAAALRELERRMAPESIAREVEGLRRVIGPDASLRP